MPEGDTIFRAARTLHRALAGKTVTEFQSTFPSLTRVADDRPIIGRTIESIASHGKHTLITFSGDLVLRTHMRMNGSWHLYRAGERWRRQARDMRILVATADVVAVGFNIPVAELLTSLELSRHDELRRLGPDLLGAQFDRQEAFRRIRARDADVFADVLLNQRVMAGIGNVFKSEILFIARVCPFTMIANLADQEIDRVIDVALDQLRRNVAAPSRSLAPAQGRRTTGSLHPSKGLWVYGRGGLPCRKCGTAIETRQTGPDSRLTYWCRSCQAPRKLDI